MSWLGVDPEELQGLSLQSDVEAVRTHVREALQGAPELLLTAGVWEPTGLHHISLHHRDVAHELLVRVPDSVAPQRILEVAETERGLAVARLLSAAAEPENPKAAQGRAKLPLSAVPITVLRELGVAMWEGAAKYGRHNFRKAKIVASDYYDATSRHLSDWFEGEDIDPDSGLSHVTKAIASLTVLRDAMICGTWVDDRPARSPASHKAGVQAAYDAMRERIPNPAPPFTEKDR